MPLNVLPKCNQGKAKPQYSCNCSKDIQQASNGKTCSQRCDRKDGNRHSNSSARTLSHNANAISAPLIPTVAMTPKGCAFAIQYVVAAFHSAVTRYSRQNRGPERFEISRSNTKAGIMSTPRCVKVQAKVSKTKVKGIKIAMGVFFAEDIAAN